MTTTAAETPTKKGICIRVLNLKEDKEPSWELNLKEYIQVQKEKEKEKFVADEICMKFRIVVVRWDVKENLPTKCDA